jgi:dolichol kinase
MRYQGSITLELVRKVGHILTGVIIVLLFQAQILNVPLFGLLILVYAALLLFNLRYEKELLSRVISINRADRDIPGIDILAYFVGCWIVLALFDRHIAFASILILAFADAVAHLMSRSFGATHTFLTRTTYLEGTLAGIVAGTLAAWVYVNLVPALVASAVAMIIEAGELRIGSHHIDDNLTIPIVAACVLWVISLGFAIV